MQLIDLAIQVELYRLAIQLYKIFNASIENENWIDLNFQQNFNDRNTRVQINDVSRLTVGKNNIMNRLNCINNKLDYEWFNMSLNSFKIKCKTEFLS